MKKIMLLALATACAAVFALPAVASAGTWHVEPTPAGFPLNFTVHGGEGKLVGASATITCTTVTGSGSYENSTTGKVSLLFHGCKGPLGVSCTTSGHPSGTITSTANIHNVQLESNNTTPGVLLTPTTIDNVPAAGEGPFASFSCFGITTSVAGNGIIGEITAPKCGETKKSGTLSFGPGADGSQKWKQITTTGTSYDLTSKTGSGAWGTAMEEASATITFEREGKINCTHP